MSREDPPAPSVKGGDFRSFQTFLVRVTEVNGTQMRCFRNTYGPELHQEDSYRRVGVDVEDVGRTG